MKQFLIPLVLLIGSSFTVVNRSCLISKDDRTTMHRKCKKLAPGNSNPAISASENSDSSVERWLAYIAEEHRQNEYITPAQSATALRNIVIAYLKIDFEQRPERSTPTGWKPRGTTPSIVSYLSEREKELLGPAELSKKAGHHRYCIIGKKLISL